MNVSHALRLDRGVADGPPRPLPVVVAYLPLGLGALGIGFAAGLAWPELLIAPISFVLAGVLQGVRRWLELIRRRRAADQWLRHGMAPLPLHRWRAAELVSVRERRLLARSLDEVVHELKSRTCSSAVPLNRMGLRPHEAEIAALAERLADLARPVSPTGILLVHDLLTRSKSPLYGIGREGADQLPQAVDRILVALDSGSKQSASVHKLDGDRRANDEIARRVAR